MASDTRLTLSYDVTNATTPTYHTYADYNFVMTFTANDGCQFIVGDSANCLEYADSSTWIPADNRYVTVDGVVKQLRMTTQMKDYPTTATMRVRAYPIVQENIPVTQNLTNCTSSFSDTSIQAGSSVDFTITANYNFIFNSTPSYTINSTTDVFQQVSDSVYSDTITAPASGTITIDATAIRGAYDITYNLTSCTSNFTETSVAPNTTISFTITGDSSTANTPLIFTEPPTITNGTFTRVTDYQYTCASFTVQSDTVITATAGGVGNYEISYYLSNCSISPAVYHTNYTPNITFTVTADSHYKFSSANPPYYKIGNVDDIFYFTKISDSVYTFDTASDTDASTHNLRLYATAIYDSSPIPTPTISYGFVNIYLPTMEQMQTLSRYRFTNSDNGYVDMFQYLYKVHKMYFNIPALYTDYLTLAYYRTPILTNATTDAFVYANCGTVNVPELYRNIFDYQYTSTRIYLPFIGFQSIDTKDIMNSNVNLTYKANIVTGNILAILSTDARGEMYQFEGYGGFDIPYMVNNFQTGVNHDLYQSTAYLGSLTPTIQLTTDIPYGNNSENIFGYGVYRWCKISDIHGYFKCTDVQLIISHDFITNSEVNMINDILKNGVFVG